jgi:hypothetical protein
LEIVLELQMTGLPAMLSNYQKLIYAGAAAKEKSPQRTIAPSSLFC